MLVFVLNAGSSSVKYQLMNPVIKKVFASGICERIGIDGVLKHEYKDGKKLVLNIPMPTHREAINAVLTTLTSGEGKVIDSINDIEAIGHRTVHGGEEFASSVLITPEVIDAMKRLSPLAPLHNPANITGIEICQELMPGKPNVGVFDTAFHQTMPDYAYMYALPYDQYTKHGIRKYGFHGTSHYFVSNEARAMLEKKHNTRIIVCHLGNGSSVSAVFDGKCIDTSMGLTPVQGLMMGTRVGDIGAGAIQYMMKQEDITIDQALDIMNKKSGILGISGKSSDLREVLDGMAQGDDRCRLAIDMVAYKIKSYVGAYVAALNGVDALCFTGGIGENAALIREKVCAGLDAMGLVIDPTKNNVRSSEARDISTNASPARIFVIPTQEEYVIANDTYNIVAGGSRRK
ncbi:acetate/propionate family kinase [Aliarcobacter skirrowii]|uniref:Acetate kinase n=1 Tax=Aliarcobacter skirrowii CCUG 10374 TaxID=1032239 RepID=A0AAD0WNY8_9BACT|nr:acetate kinase [Aliarcobacter skirrowii]AXX85423.1 acetate kinase [Aliarcobacter skirrowii CCUG 10374]KAB0621165.1 acetate kinase [Aliarcobacter skirrowii CCUG 10374]MCT7446405.1 acetate kinase [Aliarcobacter skirrowii]MDX4026343.1 acetate kinase [Aliarcobacter skirrowii]MDX4034758.1 acetate kinase [Aliarcobacter skirrowii]